MSITDKIVNVGIVVAIAICINAIINNVNGSTETPRAIPFMRYLFNRVGRDTPSNRIIADEHNKKRDKSCVKKSKQGVLHRRNVRINRHSIPRQQRQIRLRRHSRRETR